MLKRVKFLRHVRARHQPPPPNPSMILCPFQIQSSSHRPPPPAASCHLMARFLSQSLIRHSPPFSSTTTTTSAARLLSHRHRSGRPDPPHLIEITLDSPESPGEPDLSGLRSRLEDAIHAVISRRSAPDWLPFLPGASYWVPPRVPVGVVEVVGKIAAASPLSEEEALSMTSVRGWPSSSFFVEDKGAAPHPAKRATKKKVTESEDEEG